MSFPLTTLRGISRCVLICAVAVAGGRGGWAADYYFSAAGSDATGNGSAAQPWRSVNKFNSLNLNPGDQAFFRAGDVFDGRLALDEQDSGVNAAGQLIAPILLGTYGGSTAADRAVIRSPPGSEGLLAYNAGGLEIRDLEFSSGGFAGGPRRSGVKFITDKTPTGDLKRLHHVRIENVIAHGFSYAGVELQADNAVGFADVSIVGSEFYANAYSGVSIGAGPWQDLVHSNVVIDNVQAHANPGYAGCAPHCGHGVVLGQVEGAVVQNSAAYENGASFGAGNVGIWAWQSNAVVIQNNLAFGNRSPSGGDGGAFDLDGGVTNSFVQYNRSYDNDGAGLLLAQFAFAGPMSQNVFRYNLSVNDGRDDYGGITVWGASSAYPATSAVFHNNTIVVDASEVPDTRGAIWFLGQNHDDVTMINNALIALDGAALISGSTDFSRTSFAGNAYWTGGGPAFLEGVAYTTVEMWAAAENQERIAGAYVGVERDPALSVDGSYRPAAYGPWVDAGLLPGAAPWPAWIGGLGSEDLRGLAVPQGAGPDIGALEVLLGDFDGDGDVDAADLQVWGDGFGASNQATAAVDLDGDGDADGAEFLSWQRRLTGFRAPVSAILIPEPALFWPSLAGALGLIRPRSRQRLHHWPRRLP